MVGEGATVAIPQQLSPVDVAEVSNAVVPGAAQLCQELRHVLPATLCWGAVEAHIPTHFGLHLGGWQPTTWSPMAPAPLICMSLCYPLSKSVGWTYWLTSNK